MKNFLFGCALAASGLTMPLAFGQDCCYPPQCDPCCGGVSFDGFYVGGNIGVASNISHRNDLDGFLTDNSGWTVIDTDFTAGVQVGYDWNCCNKLVGLVVDWNWVNTDRRVRDNPNADPDNFHRNEFNWFTTIRARAGLTVCDALVYVTAGAAVARFDIRWGDGVDDFHNHHTRWGWTGGAGTEFMLWCNWSLGLEVLWTHFAHHEHSFTTDAGTDFTFGHSDSLFVGRVLLNYRFGDLCCW